MQNYRSIPQVIKQITRGDVYYADLSDGIGSEQGGIRPVVIIQNNVGNKFSPTVIVAAISSKIDKNNLPTHVAITNLPKPSIILLEQIRTIDKCRLQTYITSLDTAVMAKVDKAFMVAIGI
ncbi:MAG: type II toxin-antitoxin system PemK/MazF family toxin [Prevotellaceae bacterium]|jgi:mRNA interferase MazF|nr:type II toxin-antitoxin system PemK/MazF family toxin [Prevotellaceae bacterium]